MVPYLVMYITSYSIRIVLLSRYVNIYDTMAPMSPTGEQPGQPSKALKYKSKYKKPKTSSKKVQKPKLIRVLLDSGSDGDLWFHKKGTPKCFPYTTRQVPKSWCTSNGNFHTEEELKKPVFKFILGPETMMKKGLS